MSGERRAKWERKGYPSYQSFKDKQKVRQWVRRVALKASQVKNSRLSVLEALWSVGDYDEYIVTAYNEVLMRKAKCSRKTVIRTITQLIEEGSIKPVHNKKGGSGREGGRGKAVVYQLMVSGQGNRDLAEYEAEIDQRDRSLAAWRYLKDKYGQERALEIMADRGLAPPIDK